jgi:hypothetical protein
MKSTYEKMREIGQFVAKNKPVWSATSITIKAAAQEATSELGFKVSTVNMSEAMKAHGLERKSKHQREVDSLHSIIDAQTEVIKGLYIYANVPDAEIQKLLDLPGLNDAVKDILRRQAVS